MIQVRDHSGRVLRVFSETDNRTWTLGYHRQFGLVSERSARSRLRQRRNAGLRTKADWESRFRLRLVLPEKFEIESLDGAMEIVSRKHAELRVRTANREFIIQHFQTCTAVDAHEPSALDEVEQEGNRISRQWPLILIGLLFLTQAFLKLSQIVFHPEASGAAEAPLEVTYLEMPSESPAATHGDSVTGESANSLGFLNIANGAPSIRFRSQTEINESTNNSGAKAGRRLGQLVGSAQGSLSGRQTIRGFGLNGTGQGALGTKNGGGFRSLSEQVSLGRAESEGGLEPSVVQATVATYLTDVRHCYESRGLQQATELEGQVTIAFEIGAEGQVISALAKRSSAGLNAVASCVAEKVQRWRFPRPEGGKHVKVTYPFLLRKAL